MPEPLLYVKSMGAAAIVSALCVLAMAGVRRPAGATRLNSVCVLAMCLGLAAGHFVAGGRVPWPAVNGLDRFLTVVVPAALGIELIAGFQRVPPAVACCLRTILAAAIPRILLHKSIYLDGSDDDWPVWQAGVALAGCAALLAGVWGLLLGLSRRSCSGVSIGLALCLATQCAGITVMMAGYIKGGAAAFLLAATLAATTLGARQLTTRLAPAIVGAGVVILFGVLFIGRFFGRLSTGCALVMLLAPLLCWVTEIPLLRQRPPWLVGSLRLALVAVPLVAVLAVVKRDFDRDLAPLLGAVRAIQGSPPPRDAGLRRVVAKPTTNRELLSQQFDQPERLRGWKESVVRASIRKLPLHAPRRAAKKRRPPAAITAAMGRGPVGARLAGSQTGRGRPVFRLIFAVHQFRGVC